ncbi:bacterio-opsin activator [Salinadaptatus halalkaliphilus]|uniref:Bacterio-opsin activator n=1 Tax=Salinadaptatus halalkaliphilus TaxID=2419781 RepID=A0A4S3TN19_9EURY|nr:helix-turn-helix domain-containing protein [Salinadaptatus halalkaliphilus]THE65684.1 bacterio-opsin activator [Salinadaptatus halalkaliphilus]
MISAQFRIQIPAGVWIREVSESCPDTTFKLLSGYRLEETAVELGEIVADDPKTGAEAVRSHPTVLEYDLLEATEGRVLSKYETSDTALYDFVELSGMPLEFPVLARDGWFEFDLTGTREDLERLQATLEDAGARFELQSLVGGTDPETVVTDRQRELLEAGLRMGYYEVPRECTLAELADSFDIDKATASTILRRGEASLLRAFLTGPPGR